MKSIGFKNFRRFVEFPELKLSEITLLVGTNNSGKSTLVKSLLLVLDYLRTQQGERLYFDRNTLDDVNIVTFGRALNNKAVINEIQFKCSLSDFHIEINCIGNNDDTFASITKLIIKDNKENICLTINYKTDIISFELKNEQLLESESFIDEDIIDSIKTEIESLKKQIDGISDFNETLKLQYDLSSMEQKLKKSVTYNKPTPKNTEYTIVEYPINHRIQNDITEIMFSAYIEDFVRTNRNFISHAQDKKKKTLIHGNNIVDMKYLDQHTTQIYEFLEKLKSTLYKNRFIYLAAHSSKQSALFSIRDKSNILSMAVHEFHKLKLSDLAKERTFVKTWMQKFNIGDDFVIEPHASEAYTLKVLSNEQWVHLGDKGMGSIQLMILILQLATLISQYKDCVSGNIVMIEEPELNLHPKLQSQLADLFFELNEKYDLRFLIETHSEYLIRRTQVMVAQLKCKDKKELDDINKFSVYYFPEQKLPFSMEYRTDGKFSNEFGTGFFDVAADLAFEIF